MQAILVWVYGLLYAISLQAQPRLLNDAERISNNIFHQIEGVGKVSLLAKSSDICKYHDGKQNESFYIYNSIDGQPGFVIVSGDEAAPAVLAFSDNTQFDVCNIPDNVRYLLDEYDKGFVPSQRSDNYLSIDGLKQEGIAPLLAPIRWGQGSPYNLQCPLWNAKRCVTGCVATAMAMVMKYYEHPQCGVGTITYETKTNHIHVRKELSNYPFSWEHMLTSYSNTFDEHQASSVANLMACCGAVVKMDYSPDGSGAYQYDMLNGYIQNFNYDRDGAFMLRDFVDAETWHSLLVKELNGGRPVNYAGSNNVDGGHSFVIDGYQLREEVALPYYHLNWGWEGACDGYYLLSDLHPREGQWQYTQSSFRDGQQMLIGIKPEDNIEANQRYLCSDGISLSSKSNVLGNRLTVTSANIYNMSYKSFSGTVAVFLHAEGMNDVMIGEKNLSNLTFLQGSGRISIECDIPQDLSKEEFQVKLKSLTINGDWHEVFIPSPVFVSAHGNPSEDLDEETILCMSELEVYKVDDKRDVVNLNLYEVYNYSETTFDGTLHVLVTNRTNQVQTQLGVPIELNEMLGGELVSSPLSINFQVPDELANGTYRLCIGAKRTESSDYQFVRYYDTSLKEEPQMYYLDMIVMDNEVRINNIVFERPTTSVEEVQSQNMPLEKFSRVDLLGRKHNSTKGGLYIQKGKKYVTQ